ncbi:MAG: DUF4399 domain-containing protein [Burkholderiales bacterium]
MKKTLILLGLLVTSLFGAAQGVDFIYPKDGDTVEPTFWAKFSVTGLELAPANVVKSGTGHHHLFINAVDIEENVVIPFDNQHKHDGKGQSEAEIFLQPGKYKLTLQFGDGAHRSYGAAFRKTISINVVGKP